MKLTLQIVMWIAVAIGTIVLATAFSKVPAWMAAGVVLAYGVAAICWAAMEDWNGGAQ